VPSHTSQPLIPQSALFLTLCQRQHLSHHSILYLYLLPHPPSPLHPPISFSPPPSPAAAATPSSHASSPAAPSTIASRMTSPAVDPLSLSDHDSELELEFDPFPLPVADPDSDYEPCISSSSSTLQEINLHIGRLSLRLRYQSTMPMPNLSRNFKDMFP